MERIRTRAILGRGSDNLALGKTSDQLQICFQEVVPGKVLSIGPLDVPKNAIFELTVVFVNDVKTQLYGAASLVDMVNTGDLLTDRGVDS
jgi:hypothetical protein